MPSIWIIGGIVAVLVIACLFAASRKGGSGGADLISDPARPTMDDVRRLARAGHKIAAIKYYRKIHNVSLVEAKNAVEKIPAAD